MYTSVSAGEAFDSWGAERCWERHDLKPALDLLHGGKAVVYADASSYLGTALGAAGGEWQY